MLNHTREAAQFASNRTRADLDTDRLLSLALVRLLEIVGEAAGRTSPALRARYPDIPWNDIIGLRNRLIHAYDAVDYDILWRIIEADVPELVKELERIVVLEGGATG